MSGCERLDDAAVYVLGALPEGEAARYAAHLETCTVCSTRVAELTPVASSLAVAVPLLSPSPGLRDRLMREVEAEAELLRAAGPAADRPAPARRNRFFNLRPLPAVAWSCLVLALGIGSGIVLAGDEEGGETRVVAGTVNAPETPDATATLHMRDGVARLVVDGLPAPPQGRVYQVWLDHPGDSRPPEPTDVLFSVNHQGRASVDVPGDLSDVSDIKVTDEPARGSLVPTGDLIVSAKPS